MISDISVVRSGPGEVYPVLAFFAKDSDFTLLGSSGDGEWLEEGIITSWVVELSRIVSGDYLMVFTGEQGSYLQIAFTVEK